MATAGKRRRGGHSWPPRGGQECPPRYPLSRGRGVDKVALIPGAPLAGGFPFSKSPPCGAEGAFGGLEGLFGARTARIRAQTRVFGARPTGGPGRWTALFPVCIMRVERWRHGRVGPSRLCPPPGGGTSGSCAASCGGAPGVASAELGFALAEPGAGCSPLAGVRLLPWPARRVSVGETVKGGP